MTGIAIEPATIRIPGLRQELRIEPGAPMVNGAPSWTLFDPVRHAFFQLGKLEVGIFARWASGELSKIGDDLKREGIEGQAADRLVARVVDFSISNQLTVAPLGDAVATFTAQRRTQRKAWWRWLVDNYLFFRIPLVRPARFLERTLPRVAPLITLKAVWLFAALAVFGFYLVSRQWDAFLASFVYFFSWDGVLAYAFGLSAVKIVHELGHAYTATRYGCRVPSMGVSFLVMFPMLYTDTTSAWRLRSRRERLAIDCAGVSAELMVATLATLAWVVVPDGTLRSTLFVLATSSWVMSLAINLNPFMRFDGYYVLADMIGVSNLQPRAFALGRWKLRELLFGLGETPPETVPRRLQTGLVVYAWLTWLYRLVLFIGIALLVYHLFFKLLGIVLFVVEIAVFVARPVWHELKEWRARRDRIFATRRGRMWPWIGGALVVLAVLPLDRQVSAVAVLAPVEAVPVVAGDAARIERIAVKNGQTVEAGTIIAELSAPEIAATGDQRATRIRQIESQLARAPADKRDLADLGVLERQLATERAAATGVEQRRQRLVLRAPIAGVVTDIGPEIHVGRWLNGAEAVAHVVSPGRYDVQAYVGEADARRIVTGSRARFVPDDLAQPSRAAKLVESSGAAVESIDQPMLASTNGGPIAVDEDDTKRLKPRDALYRFRFVVAVERRRDTAVIQPISGRLLIDAGGTSAFDGIVSAIAKLWRSEASVN
jgi:putative peptide zinc metalloprotease protein